MGGDRVEKNTQTNYGRGGEGSISGGHNTGASGKRGALPLGHLRIPDESPYILPQEGEPEKKEGGDFDLTLTRSLMES